jgi:hypothetical protein
MASYDSTLNSYLKIAGNKIGNKLFLDKNGLCVMKKGDTNQEYAIELPNDSEAVYFYAPICKVPYECSEEFFEKVLELNLCGIEYSQATFGLDAKTQNIVLSYARSMDTLDEVSFSNVLCNFIKTVDRAKRDLTKITSTLIEQTTLIRDDIDMEMRSYGPAMEADGLKA